ncbi:MAG TPA: hypothetical protein DEB39_09885, partial [Planctomycetaceae bacterium]|nr:hypothetical protein [Planctomycetaceae bacterium]
FVEHKGRKTYFSGKFNSPESLKEYSDFARSPNRVYRKRPEIVPAHNRLPLERSVYVIIQTAVRVE